MDKQEELLKFLDEYKAFLVDNGTPIHMPAEIDNAIATIRELNLNDVLLFVNEAFTLREQNKSSIAVFGHHWSTGECWIEIDNQFYIKYARMRYYEHIGQVNETNNCNAQRP
jgi:hypothetical protein